MHLFKLIRVTKILFLLISKTIACQINVTQTSTHIFLSTFINIISFEVKLSISHKNSFLKLHLLNDHSYTFAASDVPSINTHNTLILSHYPLVSLSAKWREKRERAPGKRGDARKKRERESGERAAILSQPRAVGTPRQKRAGVGKRRETRLRSARGESPPGVARKGDKLIVDGTRPIPPPPRLSR